MVCWRLPTVKATNTAPRVSWNFCAGGKHRRRTCLSMYRTSPAMEHSPTTRQPSLFVAFSEGVASLISRHWNSERRLALCHFCRVVFPAPGGDLTGSGSFADFIAKGLVPCVRKNYRIRHPPPALRIARQPCGLRNEPAQKKRGGPGGPPRCSLRCHSAVDAHQVHLIV